jgi:tetratricopeptide (TPR) repeat protein
MLAVFLRCAAAAFGVLLLATPLRLSAATGTTVPGACVVPKRVLLTGIIFLGQDDTTVIARRLKSESFDVVANSVPDRFAHMGWMTVDQLKGTGYAPAIALKKGQTTPLITEDPRREFLHAQDVRPEMTCDRAIAMYPSDTSARMARASHEISDRNFKAAIVDYSAAIAADPDLKDARYGRAIAYYETGNNAEALKDADYAAGSNVGEAYALRAMIHEAMGDDGLATADANSAVQQYTGWGKDAAPGFYALASAYLNLGFDAAAIAQFDALLKLHPGHGTALLGRGLAYFSQGDTAKAHDDLLAASSGVDAQRSALSLAVMQYADGNLPEALTSAKRAAALGPRDPYAAIWMLLISRSLHGSAPSIGSAVAATSAWPGPVLRAYLGQVPFDSLDAAAASPSPFTASLQLCEARFYVGIDDLQRGRKDVAREKLQLAATQCPPREVERSAAKTLLRSL